MQALLSVCALLGASVAVDEAHLVAPKGKPLPAMVDMALRGRHYGPRGADDKPVGSSLVAATPAPQQFDGFMLQMGGVTLYLSHLPHGYAWARANNIPPDVLPALEHAEPRTFARVHPNKQWELVRMASPAGPLETVTAGARAMSPSTR